MTSGRVLAVTSVENGSLRRCFSMHRPCGPTDKISLRGCTARRPVFLQKHRVGLWPVVRIFPPPAGRFPTLPSSGGRPKMPARAFSPCGLVSPDCPRILACMCRQTASSASKSPGRALASRSKIFNASRHFDAASSGPSGCVSVLQPSQPARAPRPTQTSQGGLRTVLQKFARSPETCPRLLECGPSSSAN